MFILYSSYYQQKDQMYNLTFKKRLLTVVFSSNRSNTTFGGGYFSWRINTHWVLPAVGSKVRGIDSK